jgi:hypothetical protein
MFLTNTTREARMPLKKSGAMRAAGLAAAVCGLALTPSAALAADSTEECTIEATAKVFSFLGDYNEYFTAPGGDFEGELTWATSGDVEQKSSPLSLLGRRVVDLGSGAAIESPALCVDVTRPHIRFGVKPPYSGTLTVQAVADDGTVADLGSIDAATQRREHSSLGWSASPNVPLSTALGVTSGSRTVKLRIAAQSGSWDVDSVNVDPARR